MSTDHKVGVGIGVFVCQDGKTLFQRRFGAHGTDTWAHPGGKMHSGETPEQAGIREVKEETDLDVTDLQFLGFTNDIFEADGLHYITLHYATNKVSGTPKITEPEKCTALEWFDFDNLPSPVFLTLENLRKNDIAMQQLRNILKGSAA